MYYQAKYDPNPQDHAGKHDFDVTNAKNQSEFGHPGYRTNTVSIGVFKWELTANRKRVKKSKAVVRICFTPATPAFRVLETAERIVKKLDAGTYNGPKRFTIGISDIVWI